MVQPIGQKAGQSDDMPKMCTTELGLVGVTHGQSSASTCLLDRRSDDDRHICTYSVAHVLYLAKEGFEQQGYIPLNNLTRPFWADLLGSAFIPNDIWIQDEVETKGMYGTALRRLGEVGDKFMDVGKHHAPEGRMSEQFDR